MDYLEAKKQMWLHSSKNIAFAIKKPQKIGILRNKNILFARKDCVTVLPEIKLPQADDCRTFPSQSNFFFSLTPTGTT